jgi:hypothetical protein
MLDTCGACHLSATRIFIVALIGSLVALHVNAFIVDLTFPFFYWLH